MLAGQEINLSKALLVAVVGLVTVICVLALIAVCILVISRVFEAVEKSLSKKNKKENSSDTVIAPSNAGAVSGVPLPGNESQGELKLQNVDEPTAAVIMAIVSNQSGIPLNRLAFKSIKLIEEK